MDLGQEYYYYFSGDDIREAQSGCLFEAVNYYLNKSHKRLSIKPCFLKNGELEKTGEDIIYEVMLAEKVDYDAEKLVPYKFTLGKDIDEATQNAEIALFDDLLIDSDKTSFYILTTDEYNREMREYEPR